MTQDAGQPDAAIAAFGVSAVFDLNLAPDEACMFGPEPYRTEALLPSGLYDMSQSSERDCSSGYSIRVLVRARREPPTQQEARPDGQRFAVLNAQVTLLTTDGVNLALNQAFGLSQTSFVDINTTLQLLDTGEWAHAIVPVSLIPIFATPALRGLGVDRIHASIMIQANLATGEFLEIGPFLYPIDLCEGCLIKCASTLMASGTTREEALAGACADEVGADGRICIDDGC